MRFLELQGDGEFRLTKNITHDIPPYAILSHTWGETAEEVTFLDLENGTGKSKPGYEKIQFCGRQAGLDGLRHFWVDSCCIDKSDAAELQEAINSMFRWYRDADKCYAYLADVSTLAFDASQQGPPWESPLRRSRWFTRGWTLQELVAPSSVDFFSKGGDKLGNKKSLERHIHAVTGIPLRVLQGGSLSDFSITERMSWTERRETTREEDMAYSLLGIFNTRMPLLYGEGRENAFRRLWKEIYAEVEAALPGIHQYIRDLSGEPIRLLSFNVRPGTLPKDPNIILELRLKIDELFHGTMSFFIARYLEGRTWPQEYGFKEPKYEDFFLKLRPRLDAQFRWLDRSSPLEVSTNMTETFLLDDTETFMMSFNGEEFTPKEMISLPQKYQIPKLHTLTQNRSNFQLVLHNVSTKAESVAPENTPISIEVKGEVSTTDDGVVRRGWLQLYRSHTTQMQRDLLATPPLSQPGMSPIVRDAVLDRYYRSSGAAQGRKRVVPDDATITRNEFDSQEDMLLAASSLFVKAALKYGQRDRPGAYDLYKQTCNILWTLIPTGVPTIRLATVMYLSVERMIQMWKQDKSFERAKEVSDTLMSVTWTFVNSDPQEPEFHRMWAKILLERAIIDAELHNNSATITSLDAHIDTLRGLYISHQTQERRAAWLGSLSTSVKIVSSHNISANRVLEVWKAALRTETGDDKAFNDAARQPGTGELPVWLKDRMPLSSPWPTKAVTSEGLRYSLRVPESWEKKDRGISGHTEHLYQGNRDPDWLTIGFRDVSEHNDITHWVGFLMAVSNFPVICPLTPQPEMQSWQSMGQIPNLATKLKVDEVHGYMGVARYVGPPVHLGRIYVLLVKKGKLEWNIALSFVTACSVGASEEILNSNDHNRAGAALGTLQLDRAESVVAPSIRRTWMSCCGARR